MSFSSQPSRRAILGLGGAALAGIALAGCTTRPRSARTTARSAPPTSTSTPAPTAISALSPASGGVAGGARVTLAGSELAHVASVAFGAATAPVVSAAADHVVVEVPPSAGFAEGAVDVTARDAAGATVASHPSGFAYAVVDGLDRQMRYALAHWQDYDVAEWGDLNPAGGDCANFVSQTLIQRGWQMDDRWYNHGAGASWSPAWGFVPAMDSYLADVQRSRGVERLTFDQRDRMALGDVVIFDWNANGLGDHVQVIDRITTRPDGSFAIAMASHNKDFDFRDLDDEITVEHPGAIGHVWHLTA